MIGGLFIFLIGLSAAAASGPRKHFETWCVGQCTVSVKTNSLPGAVLMGGGTDTSEAFTWQIANAAGGDFLVMRASGDDAYNSYIYELSIATGARLNSVRTILFNDAKASQDEEVLQYIRDAEAIFFAGGDQSLYVAYWKDTEVQSIIQSKLGNVTVGGTSAGLAVLGEWIYSAEDGSTVSDEAMMNPYNKYMDFSTAFLHIPYMESIITDTHFGMHSNLLFSCANIIVTRDRMGRMLTFVARVFTDLAQPTPSVFRGVGVDEHTALLLNVTTGDVSTVGVGTAYVCSASAAPSVCKEDTPLTFHDITCMRLSAKDNDSFSFATWTGSGVEYINTITAGHLTDFPYGPKE